MSRELQGFFVVGLLAQAATVGVHAQAFPAAPTPAEVQEARQLVASMKSNERGPYQRLRWYCNDGSVHAPAGSPCLERGGGVQHAEHSPQADRLAALGFHVGTILQATSYEDFADAARAGYRLQEMVLERYLFSVDDGWVLRRARYYRGALQIEDEERAGRELLNRHFADSAWLRSNYLLATRLTANLPHTGVAGGLTMDRIRSTALEISNADPGFLNVRVKIHSVPSRADLATVDAYLARGGHTPQVRDWLVQLRTDLQLQYDPERALASLASYRGRLGADLDAGVARLSAALQSGDAERTLNELVDLAPRVREAAETTSNRAIVVDLIDLGLALQERAFTLADDLSVRAGSTTRSAALRRADQYVTLAYAAGYLSRRERVALQDEISGLLDAGEATALPYKTSLGYLSRSLDWGLGTVRGTFGPVLEHYLAVEPVSAGFPDALLRGSMLLPLSRVLDGLHTDADVTLGAAHSVFGSSEAQGLRGLNSGVAMRPLRTLEPGHQGEMDARTIYVLPETPAEMRPVAGVLTMAEGNMLSHVQLLARNLGIPNANVSATMLPLLQQAEGREVFYAVSPLGRVVLAWPDQLDSIQLSLVESRPGLATRHRLDTSRLRLSEWRPIPLSRLRATDSGVLVGPKAANLGQLAADFPGRVSDAFALPFGMFRRHADRRFAGSERTVLAELLAAYERANEMRSQGRSETEVDAYMFERLAWTRNAIESLEWLPDARAEVASTVTSMLAGQPGRGVFIRSDTNVEDLPQFSGAGLNLTIAHQTTVDDVLASVKRVWTSPFTERAYLWRKQILEEQGEVYPSVLLMETVRSDKSGVLITSGLQEGTPEDLMVVAAEGVGGAVDGEETESLILRPDGTMRLLSQTQAPRRREVVPGGTRWVAASRPETLLQPGELAQLRDVVTAWEERTAGTPEASQIWDIEYGFVDGRLWLFQIRPFIRFRNSTMYALLQELDADARANADLPVPLSLPLRSQ
ncbi:MAG: hypothetical protein OEQ13_05415 [Acidobacteriota bacterium]|nr:hypothetical protein [Acidobacteriota bacterium]